SYTVDFENNKRTEAGSQTVSVKDAVVDSGTAEQTDYSFTYKTGTLTVNKKALTITAKNQTKTKGKTFTFAGTEFTTNGLVGTDSVTSVELTSTGAPASAAVGTHPIVISENSAIGSGLDNYDITYVDGALTVKKKIDRDDDKGVLGTEDLNTVDHFAYIIGRADGLVHPGAQITRAEVATIYFRMLTDTARTGYWSQTSEFSDVAAKDWFNNAVCTMTNGNVLTGYPSGTFAPNAPITRAEFATIAVRFFDGEYQGSTNLFSDISVHWAKDYINRAAELGLVSGYGNGTFRPDQYITRAEAVKIINTILGRKPHKDQLLDDMIIWPDNLDQSAWYYADIQEATNSHDYKYKTVESAYETWTELLEVRDWVALEKQWSAANSSANPGDVLQ
ncbi:MAG: S-layer homology domain-containing protein, partial [Clostridia bacterium]|nr:S-layer homology domain-containing protein [Clostridia bacterium]